MTTMPLKKKQVWKHYNGSTYEIIEIANQYSTNSDYPVTIVYKGQNGRIWCRPANDWHRSFSFIGYNTLGAKILNLLASLTCKG